MKARAALTLEKPSDWPGYGDRRRMRVLARKIKGAQNSVKPREAAHFLAWTPIIDRTLSAAWVLERRPA